MNAAATQFVDRAAMEHKLAARSIVMARMRMKEIGVRRTAAEMFAAGVPLQIALLVLVRRFPEIQ